jgi:hypothetical protein
MADQFKPKALKAAVFGSPKKMGSTCSITSPLGQTVAIRMVRYHDKSGPRTRSLSITPTSQSPDPGVLKSFSDQVEVRNGLGFSSAGIFIPPDIVAAAGIEDGNAVEGIAIINFDKKRNAWGWKAIKAQRSQHGGRGSS